ncbi:hypothetical protein BX283_0411 [Streptomyces sp. TLI_146]|nr:hypothetical protein BX283_0411 [Streptomyces sp. TLI_146]
MTMHHNRRDTNWGLTEGDLAWGTTAARDTRWD